MSSSATEEAPGRGTGSRASPACIVYCCFGGTHSSPVAAAIHLGLLPRDRVPTWTELMAVPFFDRMTKAERGRLLPFGTDGRGRRVFVLGRGPDARSVEAAVRSGWIVAGGPRDGLRFVDTLACVNGWMRVGGFLSRAAGLVKLGRPLVLFGTQRAYRALCRLVEETEEEDGDGGPARGEPGGE